MPSPDCLYYKCHANVHQRGLCRSHYVATCHFIAYTGATWKQLEKAGKVLGEETMRRKGNRKHVHEFANWLREALKERAG